MNIENLDKAMARRKELEEINGAIKALEKYNGSSITFAEHNDRSGFYVTRQYKDGAGHPMYKDIMKFVTQRFKQAREELIKEIEQL